MEFIPEELKKYAEAYSSPEPEWLQRINRETHAKVLMPRMLSGVLQGRFLSMISRMIRPRRILEIGTYTGYSALALAEGLHPEGTLITIDKNDELEEFVRKAVLETKFGAQLELRIGLAADIIPTLDGPFDLVFIDADKENNSLYYDLVFNLVPPGGFILVDNVLWSGKVLDVKKDKDTRAVHAFNEKISQDQRVEKILLPFRDGIYLIQKLSL